MRAILGSDWAATGFIRIYPPSMNTGGMDFLCDNEPTTLGPLPKDLLMESHDEVHDLVHKNLASSWQVAVAQHWAASAEPQGLQTSLSFSLASFL